LDENEVQVALNSRLQNPLKSFYGDVRNMRVELFSSVHGNLFPRDRSAGKKNHAKRNAASGNENVSTAATIDIRANFTCSSVV